jgi:hypothetical protein
MASENRFTGLIGGLNQGESDDQATTEAKPKSKIKGKKSTVKSKDSNYTQIGVYLPVELHRKMKIAAAMKGLEISDMTAQAIETWLAENVPNI